MTAEAEGPDPMTGETWTVDFLEEDHPGMHPRVFCSGRLICEVGNAEDWVEAADGWRADAKRIAKVPELEREVQRLRALAPASPDYRGDGVEDAVERLRAAHLGPLEGPKRTVLDELARWQELDRKRDRAIAELNRRVESAEAAVGKLRERIQNISGAAFFGEVKDDLLDALAEPEKQEE